MPSEQRKTSLTSKEEIYGHPLIVQACLTNHPILVCESTGNIQLMDLRSGSLLDLQHPKGEICDPLWDRHTNLKNVVDEDILSRALETLNNHTTEVT